MWCCVAGALAVVVGCNGKVIRLGGCPHTGLPASRVLWIGDSWQLVPVGSEAHTEVRNLARAAGAIGPTDDYTIAALAAAPMVAPPTNTGPIPIPTQYTSQEASGTEVKVLIMDGGTWDTFTNDSSETITAVVKSFTDLLSTVASGETVSDVIYFLQPPLASIPGVAALRPGLEGACTASMLPCHFIDLANILTDPADYTAGSENPAVPSVPTAQGATLIGDAIWSVMQSNCIAQ